jgi:hypothetical protein
MAEDSVDLAALEVSFKHFQNPEVANPVEVQLASEGLALAAELKAARAAGDQLRAVITDLIIWARRGWTLKANVDQLEADAARLLDTIQSPPELIGKGR